MRRFFSSVLVLGLALFGPSPVSVCALASSLLTECASPETQSQCAQMEMGMKSSPGVTAGTASCCAISKAPSPEAKSAPSTPLLQQGSASITVLVATLAVNHGNDHFVDVLQDASPPTTQSLLCTFLI